MMDAVEARLSPRGWALSLFVSAVLRIAAQRCSQAIQPYQLEARGQTEKFRSHPWNAQRAKASENSLRSLPGVVREMPNEATAPLLSSDSSSRGVADAAASDAMERLSFQLKWSQLHSCVLGERSMFQAGKMGISHQDLLAAPNPRIRTSDGSSAIPATRFPF